MVFCTENQLVFCQFDELKKDFTQTKISAEAPKIYARFDKNNKLVTVEEITNNLRISNIKENKVTEFSGNEEEPYRKPPTVNHPRIR